MNVDGMRALSVAEIRRLTCDRARLLARLLREFPGLPFALVVLFVGDCPQIARTQLRHLEPYFERSA